MQARFRKLLGDPGDTFWLLPAAIVMIGVLLALADAERSVGNADDLANIRRSFDTFEMMRQGGTVAAFQSTERMQEP